MINKRINTLCVHGGKDTNNSTGSANCSGVPVGNLRPSRWGESTGYDYSPAKPHP